MLDYIIITIVIAVIYHWIQSKPFYWRSSGIPYSLPLPLLGNASKAFVRPFHEVFVDLYEKCGDSPVYGFHLFGTPALMVRDSGVIKNIMVTNADHFMSHGFHSNADYDPLGKALFFVDGEEWRTIRSKMTPYFTPARLKGMLHMITPTRDKYVQCILESSKKGPVEVENLSRRYTVDAIMTTVFGIKPDSLDNPESFFFKIQKELVSFFTGVKTMVGDMSPGLYAALGLTVLSGKTTKTLMELVNDIIKQRTNKVGVRPDFVQGMVDLMEKEDKSQKEKNLNSDGTPVARFDDFTVAGQCMIMYVAGTETTSSTISFLLYELALNQDVQDKARSEINHMLKSKNNEYGYDDMVGLKYIHMIFYETMRKYPVVTTYSRKCTKAINIDGLHIPVGTKLMLSPYAMSKDTKFYPEPEKFIPERFEKDSITAGAFIPYGMGPRTCIGIKFAEMEVCYALCSLLPKVKVKTSPLTEIPIVMNSNPTLSSLNGIWLNFEEIK